MVPSIIVAPSWAVAGHPRPPPTPTLPGAAPAEEASQRQLPDGCHQVSGWALGFNNARVSAIARPCAKPARRVAWVIQQDAPGRWLGLRYPRGGLIFLFIKRPTASLPFPEDHGAPPRSQYTITQNPLPPGALPGSTTPAPPVGGEVIERYLCLTQEKTTSARSIR